MKTLSIEKAKQKAELEAVIDKGISSFIEVGGALAVIKANGLYKNEYPTFEKYCEVKWDLTKRHIYRKIEAFKVAQRVSKPENGTHVSQISQQAPNGTHALQNVPEPNQRQASELAKLPENKQAETWSEVVDAAPRKNGKPQVTAKLVKAAVNSKANPTVKSFPRSKSLKRGELYEDVAEAIAAKAKFNEILSHIAKAKALAKTLSDTPLGAYINWNRLDIDLKNVRGNIRIAMPYGPCPYCAQDGCKVCNKQGWLTKMKIDAAGDQ